MSTNDQRMAYLEQFRRTIERNCVNGAFLRESFPIRHVSPVCGPRAGAIEFSAGVHTGKLMEKLNQHQGALLRNQIPWTFTGEPIAFMDGRYLRLEAGWPLDLADTKIPLDRIGRCPGDKLDRWTVGVNERGARVSAGFNVYTPHWLFAGQTQSGKSTAVQSMAMQLAKGSNQLVLCDGKRGESLHVAAHWHGVVGPVAIELREVRNALGWAYHQMIRRYDQIAQGADPRMFHLIVVVFDEFQELTSDPVVATLMRKLAAQGAAGRVHCVSATQHPVIAAFGDQRKTGTITRRQFPGKLAFTVDDFEASKVAVAGETPRADHLLGQGDAYVVARRTLRIQGAYVDEHDFQRAPVGEWKFEEWPLFDPTEIGKKAATGDAWTPDEAAVGLAAAMSGIGRPAMVDLYREHTKGTIGAGRARRLLSWARKTWKRVEEMEMA